MSPKKLPELPGRNRPNGTPARSTKSLFGDLAASGRLRSVPVDAITPNPRQPRTHFDEAGIKTMADSIQAMGLLQPPVVRDLGEGAYELIAGERRWRGAILAGKTEIEVLLKDTAEPRDHAILAILENTVRENLSPIDLARAYATTIDDLGFTRAEVARTVGVSRSTVSNHLRLLDLPDEALTAIHTGQLTFAHGLALLLTDSPQIRSDLARQAIEHGWSKRQLEDAAREAGAPRTRTAAPPADADHTAFAKRLAAAAHKTTGLPIRVRANARGECTISYTAPDQAAANAYVQRLAGDISK